MICRLSGSSPRRRRHGRSLVIPTLGPDLQTLESLAVTVAIAKPVPSVTTGPLPDSTKVFKPGLRHPDIRVPMREIALHPTVGEPPVTIYDPSGLYTDAVRAVSTDRGLPRICEAWLRARGDTMVFEGRAVMPADKGSLP